MDNFVNGDPAVDFFEQNPEHKFTKLFVDLISEYGESRASKLAWSIYMLEDPNSSKHRYEREERKKEIAELYLNEPDFDWDSIKRECNDYASVCLNEETRLYKFWSDFLEEIRVQLKDIPDVGARVKIAKDYYQAMESYNKSRKVWLEEKDKGGKLYGNKQESFSEELFD